MGVITDLTNTGWDRNAVVGSKFSMQESSHGLVGTFTGNMTKKSRIRESKNLSTDANSRTHKHTRTDGLATL